MTITVRLRKDFTLAQNVTLANNIVARNMRKVKKRYGPWPTSKLVRFGNGEAVYEITEAMEA